VTLSLLKLYVSMSITFIIIIIKEACKTDELAVEITNDLAEEGDNNNKKWWMEINGLLVRRENPDQIYVQATLRKMLIKLQHDSEYAGHLGVKKTCELVKRNYFWLGMSKDIAGYVRSCTICVANKDAHHAKYGTAVRVPIPEIPWQKVQMDFITDLPIKNRRRQEDEEYLRSGCVMICSDELCKKNYRLDISHSPLS